MWTWHCFTQSTTSIYHDISTINPAVQLCQLSNPCGWGHMGPIHFPRVVPRACHLLLPKRPAIRRVLWGDLWWTPKYLVGGLNPSEKKNYSSQLGLWHSQLNGKINVPHHQPDIVGKWSSSPQMWCCRIWIWSKFEILNFTGCQDRWIDNRCSNTGLLPTPHVHGG